MTYLFKSAELQADGKLAAQLTVTSNGQMETVAYQLGYLPNTPHSVNAYRVWYRQNGNGVVLVDDGMSNFTHQMLPVIHRCAG